ncbi:CWF19-like protein 2 [Aplysia californica]|uniref:CWF19-like protein 2 n=1 Tax=Aplysia californica TaxID=6500 RepID=A0ABM0JSL3_APLCA|nr:CWF19-like protein 2 [Aplysia californica]
MSSKYNNFQSQSSIDEKKEENRKARQLILEQAKRKHDREEAKNEKARKLGEGTWMLDSVSQRIAKEEKDIEKRSKKKHKKEKKKKKKKKKKRSSSSSSSSTEDEGDDWVEAKTSSEKKDTEEMAIKGPQLQRESWMEAPLDFMPLTSRKEIREAMEKEKKAAREESEKMFQPGQHTRELNPYWKNGGTGLPEEAPSKSSTAVVSQGSVAGDGGLSWLRTAYKRFKQQAEDEGRSLEEVVAERYGSLRKLENMLQEAEQKQRTGGGQRFHQGTDAWRRSVNDRDRSRRRSRSPEESDRRGGRGRSREISGDRMDRRDTSMGRRDRNEDMSYKRSFQRPSGSDDNEDSREESRDRGDRKDRGMRREDRYDEKSNRRTFQKPSDSDEESSRAERKNRSARREDQYEERSNRKTFQRPLGSDEESSEERTSKYRKDSNSKEGRPRGFMRPGDAEFSRSYDRDRDRPRSRESQVVSRWKKKQPSPDVSSKSKEDKEGLENSEKRGKSEKKRKHSEGSSDSSSESSESDEEVPKAETSQPPPKIMTEEELNDLAAKILRAEIMGDDDMKADLEAKLKSAREARDAAKSGESSLPDFSCRKQSQPRDRGGDRDHNEEDNVVVLSRRGRGDMLRPVVGETKDGWDRGGRKGRKKNVTTHDSKGERTQYFDNDDRLDLKTLVEQEKTGTAEDQNAMFARLAGRSTDRDLDVDDMFVDKAARKQNEDNIFNKDRSAAIYEHKKISAAMEKCHRCFDKVPKHLIIAIGSKSYLCLPQHRSLTEGHCLIVPMQHVSAGTALDEDIWQEMQLFRKSLVQMFAAQDQDVVIMETVMHIKHFPHTALECVPLEREVGDLSPIYFKKAIQEVGPEWADNKKLIDLSKKDVRRAIPKGFPYFAVDFGLQGGFATVIEDEATFPAYFGREIVGGMIDAEPTLWRKPHKENFESQRNKVLQFEQWWKPYDWTQNV